MHEEFPSPQRIHLSDPFYLRFCRSSIMKPESDRSVFLKAESRMFASFSKELLPVVSVFQPLNPDPICE